jgi:chromate transporter
VTTEERKESVSAIKLFLAFLRLGTTAFGGPAMIPYIQEMVVKRNVWVSPSGFRNGVALCQSIPGATAMQTAAFCGLRAGGVRGAVAAYAGFGLPAFLLMVAFSIAYGKAQTMPLGVSVFTGLRAIVIALMANAAINFSRSSLKNIRDILLAIAAALFLGFGGPPVVAILMTAIAAAIVYRGINISTPREAGGNREPEFQVKKFSSTFFLPVLIVVCLAGIFFLLSHRLAELAALMAKIDLFAFGGGFASIPLMLHEIVQVRGWMDSKTFMDGIALGQVTPGPIVITATFVGYQVLGLIGAAAATLGIFTPSFLILLISVPYFDRWQRSVVFRRVLRGALLCFVGLLFVATARFAMAVPWSVPCVVLAVAAFLALRFKLDIIWIVLAGVVISAVVL